MRIVILLLAVVSLSQQTLASSLAPASSSDLRAIVEDGRKVLLSPDGRWRFDTRSISVTSVTPQSQDFTSPYQTGVKKISISFNTSEWMLMPRRDSDDINKRHFQHKSLPIHAMVIADEMPATTQTLKRAILYNAKQAGGETAVLLDQQERVSGKDVGVIRFAASKNGMDFVFSGYYYADDDGNVQLTCFTAQKLFHKYQSECQALLNGLTIQ